MGLFTNFFSSIAPKQPPVKQEVVFLMGTAKYDLEIVGEENYQAALEDMCGPRVPRGANQFENAWLILEDKNAVRVEIRGKQVGYLRPEAAIQYRRQLIAKGKPRAIGQCQAVIRGGWISSDGRKGPYFVSLDISNFFQ
jgi:hypothetical protein